MLGELRSSEAARGMGQRQFEITCRLRGSSTFETHIRARTLIPPATQADMFGVNDCVVAHEGLL